MRFNENIPIHNIYYMLSYAYKALYLSEFKQLSSEKFENIKDLYAEILTLGIPVIIRGGLIKDYIRVEEPSTVIRGKIDINDSIKKNALVNKKLIVLYDVFSEDILPNQIIKTTLLYLCRSNALKKEQRKKLHGFLPYFSQVSTIELSLNLWEKIQYTRENLRYQFLMTICRFLYEECLLSERDLEKRKEAVDDTQNIHRLYELFLFNYYKKEFPQLKVTASQIPWALDDGIGHLLPVMQSDIMLEYADKTLIIDAKYYTKTLQKHGAYAQDNSGKIHSANLYQIFTYVKNKEAICREKFENPKVSGMLLYAKTDEVIQPDHVYQMSGNKITVKTLDLNQEFEGIKAQLNEIVTQNLFC